MKNVTKTLTFLLLFVATINSQLSAQDFAYQTIKETSHFDVGQLDHINYVKPSMVISHSTVSALTAQLKQYLVVPSIVEEYNLRGKSIVNVYIDISGAITQTEIVQSMNSSLDAAIIKALKSVKGLDPVSVNGKSTAHVIQLPIVIQ